MSPKNPQLKNVEALTGGGHGMHVLVSAADWIKLGNTVQNQINTRYELKLASSSNSQVRARIEDKGAIAAFHWRGVPDEDAAHAHLEKIAREAEAAGLQTHWGRKVLEIRPPIPIDKGQAVRTLVERAGSRAALFGGDDVTDLDAFGALEALQAEGKLEAVVRVGVRSDEGPAEIVERADLVVDGVEGFTRVLAALAAG